MFALKRRWWMLEAQDRWCLTTELGITTLMGIGLLVREFGVFVLMVFWTLAMMLYPIVRRVVR